MAADGGARSRQRLNPVLRRTTNDDYFIKWLASSKPRGVFFYLCTPNIGSEKANVPRILPPATFSELNSDLP